MARSATTSDVFNAIAEERRREILDVLIDGELAVGEIAERMAISQPQASKHLRVLSDVGLVRWRADGRQRFYRLEPAELHPMQQWLARYEDLLAAGSDPAGHDQPTAAERKSPLMPDRRGSAVVEYPSELEIRITREFDAPKALVFEAMTNSEHLRKTLAPYGEEVRRCEVDLRAGGDYHFVFVAEDGTEMSFHGTFIEVSPPNRTAQTWFYDGWPDAEALESMDLDEVDGVTTMTYRLVFSDRAGRDQMSATDGLESNFDNVDELLKTLLGGQAG